MFSAMLSVISMYIYVLGTLDIVELEVKLRLQPGISRILGANRVWDQDWGLPRVKCGTEGCNQTLCTPKAGLVISWSDRRERSEENPGAGKKKIF